MGYSIRLEQTSRTYPMAGMGGGKGPTDATTAVGYAVGTVSFVCVRLTPTFIEQTLRPLAAPGGHLSRQLVLPSRVTQMSGGWLC